GLGYTLGLAMALTAGRLLIPILVQQILDRGLNGPAGFRPRFVYGACAVAAGVVGLVYLAGRATYRRLVRASETSLATLRVRAFDHIHKLSIAAQTAEKRGAFVSRVTADVDTIGQFLEWGGMSWITSTALMFGTAVAMFVYSWQLALVVLLAVSPLFLVLRMLQKGMLRAYDRVRTRAGERCWACSRSRSTWSNPRPARPSPIEPCRFGPKVSSSPIRTAEEWCFAGSTSTWQRVPTWPSWVRPAAARPRLPSCCVVLPIPPP